MRCRVSVYDYEVVSPFYLPSISTSPDPTGISLTRPSPLFYIKTSSFEICPNKLNFIAQHVGNVSLHHVTYRPFRLYTAVKHASNPSSDVYDGKPRLGLGSLYSKPERWNRIDGGNWLHLQQLICFQPATFPLCQELVSPTAKKKRETTSRFVDNFFWVSFLSFVAAFH